MSASPASSTRICGARGASAHTACAARHAGPCWGGASVSSGLPLQDPLRDERVPGVHADLRVARGPPGHSGAGGPRMLCRVVLGWWDGCQHVCRPSGSRFWGHPRHSESSWERPQRPARAPSMQPALLAIRRKPTDPGGCAGHQGGGAGEREARSATTGGDPLHERGVPTSQDADLRQPRAPAGEALSAAQGTGACVGPPVQSSHPRRVRRVQGGPLSAVSASSRRTCSRPAHQHMRCHNCSADGSGRRARKPCAEAVSCGASPGALRTLATHMAGQQHVRPGSSRCSGWLCRVPQPLPCCWTLTRMQLEAALLPQRHLGRRAHRAGQAAARTCCRAMQGAAGLLPGCRRPRWRVRQAGCAQMHRHRRGSGLGLTWGLDTKPSPVQKA